MKMNQILELSSSQTRQYIDAETIFLELRRSRADVEKNRGRMFWRKQSAGEYLIRESSGGAQTSLGLRDAKTQKIFDDFSSRKAQALNRLKSLEEAADEARRLNKALRVGRVPEIVIKTLNALESAGLQDHFLTIGTHSLYAYESACGVRFLPGALATQDIDLLFDSRKRIEFVSRMKQTNLSFIGALQKADPTFRVRQSQKQTAINDKGFEVDVIRRMAKDGDPHPFRMSDDENDLWAVQINSGDKILGAEKFEQVIVSETGRMAVMHTMSPLTFVAVKQALSVSPTRDPKKAPKDALQAKLVSQLIQNYMPQYLVKPKNNLSPTPD